MKYIISSYFAQKDGKTSSQQLKRYGNNLRVDLNLKKF